MKDFCRRNKGCLPFTKTFRKSPLESQWYTTFWVVPVENFRGQRNVWKRSPVFLDGMFQTGNSCSICSNFILDTSFRLSRPFSASKLGDGRENVTFKMTSQSFKLLGDYSDSFCYLMKSNYPGAEFVRTAFQLRENSLENSYVSPITGSALSLQVLDHLTRK